MTIFLKNSWAYLSVILSLIVIIPILIIFLFLFNTGDDTWLHLKNTVLTSYIVNSLILLIFSALGTLIIGVTSAWLVAMYIFPFKKYIEWLLVLPLAIPSYALAYVYSDLLNYGGFLTLTFSYIINNEINAINFYSIYGAIFVFIFSLYPYVYLLARQAFIVQSGTYIEVAKVSGLNLLSIFYKVAIPLARPALIGGVILVMMETLADFGVADYLGIETFTKGIKKPIITGILQIINAVMPKYLFRLKNLKFLELLVSLLNSALPLRIFSTEIIREIVISKIIDSFPADTISPKLNQAL